MEERRDCNVTRRKRQASVALAQRYLKHDAVPTGHKRPAASDEDISMLAKKAKLNEDDGNRLNEEVVLHFETTADITHSALHSWQPALTEQNISYIVHRRNVEAITVRLTPLSFVTCCACISLLLKVEPL